MIIDLDKFVRTERPFWEELEAALDRLEVATAKSVPDLAGVNRLVYLFERASADLAKLETYAADPETVRYLQRLVARAYGELHAESRQGVRLRPLSWFFGTFPETVRRHAGLLLVSFVLTLLGGAFGAGAVVYDAQAKGVIMPFPHLLVDPSERVAMEEADGGRQAGASHAVFASQLMTHNTKVSIFAMALGLTFGLGTGVVLFYNGVILGAVVADFVAAGESVFLAGWLLPHGSVEIPCILIAGQAGLVLGRALIGRGTRDPLAARMRAVRGDVATLIGGVAVILVWAGLIESFVSQFHNQPWLPYSLKIAFGTGQLMLLGVFLWKGGMRSGARREESAGGA
ncbi:MAG: stage II sporulation protein M [Opitutales bacterium]